MTEVVIGVLACGALKLVSSLVNAGSTKLFGEGDEHHQHAMAEWSGDVIVKAREQSGANQREVCVLLYVAEQGGCCEVALAATRR